MDKEIKEIKFNLDNIIKDKDHVLLVDNYNDEKYFKKLEVNVVNIHSLYKELFEEDITLIKEIDKYIFISKELSKDINNSTFRLGNFFGEYKLYDVDKKAKMINFEITPNFKRINDIYEKYEKYKKDNNYFDMPDLLYRLKNTKMPKYKNLYLFNFIYLDKTRMKIVQNIIGNAENVFLTKYYNQNYTNAEKIFLNRNRNKHGLKGLATYKKLETKTSIFSFLKRYQEINKNKRNGFIILNHEKFNFFTDNINWNEIYFVYSIFNIKYGNWDYKDIDNILKFLELDDEINKFNKLLENHKMIRSIDFIKEIFKENEKLDFVLNIVDLEKKEILIKIIDKFKEFHFLKDFLPLVDYINNDNFIEDFKSLIYIHLKENVKLDLLYGMEEVIWSEINNFDKIFILYGGIKEQKESFLANNHRKDLGLMDEDSYQEIQLDLIENLSRFKNVTFLDFKYDINEENMIDFPLKLDDYDENIIPNIDRNKKVIITTEGKYEKEYKFIKDNFIMDRFPVEKLDLLLEPKKFITSFLNLKSFYINETTSNIDVYVTDALESFFQNEDNIIFFKEKPVTETFKKIMDGLSYLEHSSLSGKSKLLLLRGQLIEWLKKEKKFLKDNSAFVQKKTELLFPFYVSELSSTINVYIKAGRIDKIKENNKDKYIINFFKKEPTNWKNKYHLKKVINNIAKRNKYNIKEVRFSYPY